MKANNSYSDKEGLRLDSSDKIKLPDNNRSSKEINQEKYIEIIEKKVRDQAQRLIELQSYKNLCEKKLKQLLPNLSFPLTEENVKKMEEFTNAERDNNECFYLKKQIQELKKLLQDKDQEILQNLRKNDSLNSKLSQIQKNTNNSGKNSRKVSPNHTFQFEQVNNEITPVNINTAYTNLQNNYKELNMEKERILETLRKETLLNEEQKNYIEILKQTIENTINKLGIGPLLQQQVNVNYPNRNVTNVDFLVDFTQLKLEGENYRKELVMSNILVNELKNEIEYLKKINDDMNIKKEKIRETLESGIKELEDAKERVRTLEQEKDYLNEDVETLKNEYDKTINDYNGLVTEFEKLKEENVKLLETKADLQKEVENQKLLEMKLIEHKNNFEKVSADYNALKKFSEEQETNINNYIKEMNEIKDENNTIIKDYEEKLSSLTNEKGNVSSELDILNKQFKTLERKHNEALNTIKEKNLECKRIEEKLNTSEQNFSKEKKLNETLSFEYNEAKRKTELRLHDVEKTIYDLSSHNNEMKKEISAKNEEILRLRENYEEELANNTRELKKVYNDFKKVSEINKTYIEEINEKEQNINILKEKVNNLENHVEMLSNLHIKFDDLQRETDNYLKEKNHLRNIVKKLEEDVEILKENNVQKDDIIIEKNQYLSSLQNEINELKYELDDIYNKYNKIKNELQIALKYNYEIENKLNRFVRKKEDLDIKLQELENETLRIEKMRKKLIKEERDDSSRMKSYKHGSTLKSTNNDVRLTIHTCLSTAKNYINKILKNKNTPEILNKQSFFQFSTSTDDSIITSLRSLEDWVQIICCELENCYNMLQDFPNLRKENSSNSDVQNLTLKINNLIKDNQILLKDNDTLFRKYENLKEMFSSNGKNIDTYHKETQNTLDIYRFQSLEDVLNNTMQEKKNLEALLNRVISFLPNREMSLLIKDVILLNEQVFKIQRDKIKLIGRLNELEIERKSNENDKNILIEIDNIKNLLEEYDARYSNKVEELKILENEYSTVEASERNRNDNERMTANTLPKRNETRENVFRTNMLDRQSNNNDFNKFERKSRTKEYDSLNRPNRLVQVDENFSDEKIVNNEIKYKKSRRSDYDL